MYICSAYISLVLNCLFMLRRPQLDDTCVVLFFLHHVLPGRLLWILVACCSGYCAGDGLGPAVLFAVSQLQRRGCITPEGDDVKPPDGDGSDLSTTYLHH